MYFYTVRKILNFMIENLSALRYTTVLNFTTLRINFKFHGHLRKELVHYVQMAQILTLKC